MEHSTKIQDLTQYFEQAKSNKIKFAGACHDCGKEVNIEVIRDTDGKVTVQGGALYITEPGLFCKCDFCFEQDSTLRKFQPCDVYSRVVGFLRPVSDWNKGKQSEWANRKNFKLPEERSFNEKSKV